jgi:diadenosine tetraphosphatase ApaH/serine/threonine PP2A family protein phosphatase
VVAGAVGKPRDGVPAANYVLLDTQEGTVSLRRVSYDVESVCALLRETTLPQVLARELAEGR